MQQANQQIQMIPQQMQLQSIQLTGQQQAQFVNQHEQQQIQNQIMQSQQIALQQQTQNNLNTNQASGISQITIQQAKQPQQIFIGQQSTAQSQATNENRPTMTMVSIGGNNASSPLNAMQNLSSPIGSSQTPTLQPPPNPLAAMTSLSYSAAPSNILTNSTANITKDEKTSSKVEEAPKISIVGSSAASTLTSTTVTTSANGMITITASSTPTFATATPKDRSTGKFLFLKLIQFSNELEF